MCRSCRAWVVWCTTAKGKKMPVDAEPAADGNLVMKEDGTVEVVPVGSQPKLHLSHFVTCPDRREWRKK